MCVLVDSSIVRNVRIFFFFFVKRGNQIIQVAEKLESAQADTQFLLQTGTNPGHVAIQTGVIIAYNWKTLNQQQFYNAPILSGYFSKLFLFFPKNNNW